jgi:hypothetical protein
MPLVEKSAVCPNCQGTSCFRSRRRGALEFFFHYVLFTSPYRCKDCDTRYYRTRMAKETRKERLKRASERLNVETS